MRIDIKYNADINELMVDNMSFYDFTLQELKLARYLISEGIRPQQLEHIEHNLKWAYELVARQNKEAYEKAINDIENNFGNIRLLNNSQKIGK